MIISILPKRKCYCGLKQMEISNGQEIVNKETEMFAVRLDANNILNLTISKHGAINVWVQGNKEFVVSDEKAIDFVLEDRYLNK